MTRARAIWRVKDEVIEEGTGIRIESSHWLRVFVFTRLAVELEVSVVHCSIYRRMSHTVDR